jgi:hypothetical protein
MVRWQAIVSKHKKIGRNKVFFIMSFVKVKYIKEK